ncbi:MAG: sulfatase-like hydrolase/transferase [Planctomycetota bacterium]|nr:sulfatase-like hydrolase/transferase [Planctomycetota bacterium]
MPKPLARRSFFKAAAAGAVGAAAGLMLARRGRGVPTRARPNILLIMADDMGFSDIGCYGGEVRTPNIDGLARRGIRFTQCYNNAKCGPTRASLLTGLYDQQVGTRPLKHGVTLAEVLKAAGYRTLMAGKWHQDGIPVQRGFDRYFGLADGCCNFWNPGKPREGEPPPGRKWNRWRRWAIDDKVYTPYTPQDRNFYTTDAFTDYALKYLDQYGKEDRPIFLYLAYTAPHYPLHAWPEDIARYRNTYTVGWDEIRRRRWKRQVEMGLTADHWDPSPRDPSVTPWAGAKNKDEWALRKGPPGPRGALLAVRRLEGRPRRQVETRRPRQGALGTLRHGGRPVRTPRPRRRPPRPGRRHGQDVGPVARALRARLQRSVRSYTDPRL